jgi:predicted hydrocarbon binding protein
LRTALFYSCKGGGGRTLALANIASLLTRLGNNVLCIDLDLEAPGLIEALGPPQRDHDDASDRGPGFLRYALDWLDDRKAFESRYERKVKETADDKHKRETAEDAVRERARQNLLAGQLIWESWGKHELRVIKAGDYRTATDYSDYADVMRGGYLESIYAPPRSGLSEDDATEQALIRRYKAFWRDLHHGIDGIDTDYLLIDTRTGFSPLSATTVDAFLEEHGLATAAESVDIFVFSELGSKASRLGTQEFMREIYKRYRYVDLRPRVTIVRREERLAMGPQEARGHEAGRDERREWLKEGDPDARWLGLIDEFLGVRTDPKVERTGTNLSSLHGTLKPRGLLDDYVVLTARLARRRPDEVRAVLGLERRESQDYKLFEVPDTGGLINLADTQPNISFTVNTFQLLVGALLRASSSDDAILVDVGRKAGTAFAEKLLQTSNQQAAIEGWLKIDSSVGWGLFELKPADILKFERALDKPDDEPPPCVTVANNPGFAPANQEQNLCSFLGGYIGGILSTLVGKSVRLADHGECHSKGSERCAFSFEVGPVDRR